MSLLHTVRELKETGHTDAANELLKSGNGWMLIETIVSSSGTPRYILGRVSDPSLLPQGGPMKRCSVGQE